MRHLINKLAAMSLKLNLAFLPVNHPVSLSLRNLR